MCVWYIHVHASVHIHLCTCTWKPEVNVSVFFNYFSSVFFFFSDRVFHWTWSSLIWLHWFSSKPFESICFHLPRWGIIYTCCHVQPFIWVLCWLSNSSPEACTAITLLNDPYPQLPCYNLIGLSINHCPWLTETVLWYAWLYAWRTNEFPVALCTCVFFRKWALL